MNKKAWLIILALLTFAALTSAHTLSLAHATTVIKVEIDIRDEIGSITNHTVPANTFVYVHGYYEDLTGSRKANATMEVWFDDGTGMQHEKTLYDGTIDSKQTIIETYNMTKIGTYEFRLRCVKHDTNQTQTLGFSTNSCQIEAGIASAQVFTIPEPGTILGLIMSLSAFGLFALKRSRK